MPEKPETILSVDAETLAVIDVEYSNDEVLTVPQFAGKSKVLIGRLGEDIVVSSVWRNSGKTSGDVVFERQNGVVVCDALEKLLASDMPWEQPISITNGNDKLTVSFSSSWPHNTTAPIERIQIINRRNYLLDGLESHIVEVSLPPSQARKFADSLRLALNSNT